MCPSELHVVSHQHSKPQNPFKRKIPLKMHKSNHRKISGSRTFIACKNLHLLAFFVTIHKCNQRYREEKRLLHSLSNLKIQESKKKSWNLQQLHWSKCKTMGEIVFMFPLQNTVFENNTTSLLWIFHAKKSLHLNFRARIAQNYCR